MKDMGNPYKRMKWCRKISLRPGSKAEARRIRWIERAMLRPLLKRGTQDPNDCLYTSQPKCECGTSAELELEYGFCKYGLGTFIRCPDCYEVYNFTEDTE